MYNLRLLSPHSFNSLLVIASMLPVVIFIAWTVPDWKPRYWIQKDSPTDKSLLVSWQLWLYSGGLVLRADGSMRAVHGHLGRLGPDPRLLNFRSGVGFTSLGSLAAEVDKPQKTMTRAVFALIPMTIIINVFPLLAALSQDQDHTNYQ